MTSKDLATTTPFYYVLDPKTGNFGYSTNKQLALKTVKNPTKMLNKKPGGLLYPNLPQGYTTDNILGTYKKSNNTLSMKCNHHVISTNQNGKTMHRIAKQQNSNIKLVGQKIKLNHNHFKLTNIVDANGRTQTIDNVISGSYKKLDY